MRINNIVGILSLLMVPALGFPQIERTMHWYFGDGAGIDFSSGKAVADTSSAMNSFESCATISDKYGNLLFYSNGSVVWNKKHQVMKNGGGLLGCFSSSQGVLIIPDPGNESQYYIFTTDCEERKGRNGLRYSVVDMQLQAGLGAITLKNQLLFAPAVEQLAAVAHANCTDTWLMSHDRVGNKYKCYLITPAGLDTTPIVSAIGDSTTQIGVFNGFYQGTIGTFRFFPNAKRFVAIRFFSDPIDSNQQKFNTIEVFDFDNSTGQLSNPMALSQESGWYGGAFSPDNTKLYATAGYLYQYDLAAGNQEDIIRSKKRLTDDGQIAYQALQIGLDQNLYVVPYLSRQGQEGVNYLAVIDNPNSSAEKCNFIYNAISFNNNIVWSGLPAFIESYFDTGCYKKAEAVSLEQITIYPHPWQQELNISIAGRITMSALSVEIYNLIGEFVTVDYDIGLSYDETIITLHRNDLAQGLYILSLKYNGTEHYYKLLTINP